MLRHNCEKRETFKMKVLQVISSFPPAYSYGGPLNMAYRVSKELVKRGHEVSVFTTDVFDGNSRLTFQDNPMWMDGIQVYHFRNVSNYFAHKNLTFAPRIAFALSKYIECFDVVHIREYFSYQAALAHHYAVKRGVPYVLQAHGSLPRINAQHSHRRIMQSNNRLKKIFDIFVGHSLINDASAIIATSRIESNQFQDVFADFPIDRVVHLPNCVDLEDYEGLPEKGRFRRKYDIDERAKIVLFLSRIHERKGADLLLASFSRLKRMVDFPVTLVVAGPDEGYLQNLKSLAKRLGIKNDVLFPGLLQGREKLEAYVDADVFVLPAKDRYESFGNVVLEALACGTPVIVTNNCGVSEWIGQDVGYVINYDEKALSDALNEVLRDGDLGKTLGNIGNELIKNEFDWHKGILRLEELYEAVISKNRVQSSAARPISS
jgi:glycosyltransferase involved in cell wall biosynthesis